MRRSGCGYELTKQLPWTREIQSLHPIFLNWKTSHSRSNNLTLSRWLTNTAFRLTFRELKARTIENIMQLERLGRLSRQDKFQGMLNAIAKDIRQKHRKRIQRQGEISTMESTLGVLSTKRKFLDSQLSSYNEYVEQSQTTMHKKSKKRLTIPFTTQFFHERSLAKKGMKPKFGSFVYSAAKLCVSFHPRNFFADGRYIGIKTACSSA